jgi:phosphatidylserine/phosphatidylglycerophosphate/cardiolipin synthase-like enzyme
VTAVLLLALVLAPVEVVETAPAGSGLNDATVADAIDVLPRLFNSAQQSIDLAQMYLLYYPPQSKGRALYPLYDALIAAAQRGVRVRIIVDSVTLEESPIETYQRMPRELAKVPGIELRAVDLRPHSEYPGCLMHAKYCVVDGSVALVGSHNWSFGAFQDNREVSVVVRDTAFGRELAAVFETDWQSKGNSEFPIPNDETGQVDEAKSQRPKAKSQSDGEAARLVTTSPAGLRDSSQLSTAAALAEVCAAAESTLDVEVNSISDRADFSPGSRTKPKAKSQNSEVKAGEGQQQDVESEGKRFRFVESLFAATARRGVSVRLLVDKWALERDAALLRRLDSVPNLAVRVIDITQAGPNPRAGTVHSKLVIADRRLALVGSATLSQRQVLECRNVGALTGDTAAVRILEGVFERDWFSTYSRAP